MTPFGYLRNPAARATSWQQPDGGVLRSLDDVPGLGWSYPTGSKPVAEVGLSVAVRVGGRLCQTRSDFDAIGYTSRLHTANVLSLDWNAGGIDASARFFLLDARTLALQLRLENRGPVDREFQGELRIAAPGDSALALANDHAGSVQVAAPGAPPSLTWHVFPDGTGTLSKAEVARHQHSQVARVPLQVRLQPGEQAVAYALLGATALSATPEQVEQRFEQVCAEDQAFAERAPRLSGDWPVHWVNGLHYDLQTTRLCVMRPGGVFRDVWPSWMAAYPRVVLAEGTLDMLRLAYADPELAQRAVLSLFRDAPAPNVPCIFQGGEPNMLARDGSVCGTSPAWCLPFLNLELLYLRTLDRAWLRDLFPYLEAYVRWWLANRTDANGWLTYRCTWESGEDGNPRLDPSGSGDGVISDHVRPVELQAMLAHAAEVLAFFAAELRDNQAHSGWLAVRDDFRRRTRALFDPAKGRFRDWLIQEQRFQEPAPENPYWGVDARRWSPLSLTPLLDAATPAQRQALERELALHATPPWTWWPSWAYALIESASAAGLHTWAGEACYGILDRAWRRTDRRVLGDRTRPTPGVACEYWPEDLHDWQASDAYGWGATTTNLLLRHVVGVHEARETRHWALDLAPALPRALRQPGRQYTLRNLWFRGMPLDITLEPLDGDRIGVQVRFPDGHAATRRWVARVGERRRLRLATRAG